MVGIEMTVGENDWTQFLVEVHTIMRQFQENSDLSILEALTLLEKYHTSPEVDSEVINFVENVISEIGGSPGHYQEVLNLARDSVSQAAFKEYMNS